MTRSRFMGLAMLLALALAGCESEPLSAPAPEVQQDEIAQLLSVENGGDAHASTRGGNGLFDRLAAEIPSFGGLYRTAPCTVAVVLTDLSEAEHAIRVVKAAIEPLRSCPDGIRVHPVQGEFTYVGLIRYLDAARELLRIDGVRGTKIDYKLNRLVVYVASRQVAQKVLEALPQIGIPAAAVAFQLSTGTTRR